MPCQHSAVGQTPRVYTEVFDGETDRIPLTITPPCGARPALRELAVSAVSAVPRMAEALRPKAEVGADWMPSVNISWFQCIVVPSLFGAEPVFLEGSEPIVRPRFRDVREAARAGAPSVGGPVVEQMLSTLDAAVRALPDGFHLSFPSTASPLDLAQLLLPGDEFLASLILEPEAAAEFLANLSDLCVEVLTLVRGRLAGTPSEFVTNRGLHYPGLRLPADAIVNLSPDLIRRFVRPVLQRFADRFGKLCIHYCSKPAPSDHVLGALCGCEAVGAVDTWQGPDAFIGAGSCARMQSRVALVFDVDLTSEEKMDAFLDWPPIRDVPRRGGRGLALHTSAASVAEAKAIYAMWRAKTAAS